MCHQFLWTLSCDKFRPTSLTALRGKVLDHGRFVIGVDRRNLLLLKAAVNYIKAG